MQPIVYAHFWQRQSLQQNGVALRLDKKLFQLIILATVTLGPPADNAHAGLVGPTPYLQASDSPFAAFTFDYFHLENFEDNLFNVPGVTKSAGNIIGPGLAADSVDGDDGSVDGSGNGGRSLFVVGSSLTFTFDAVALGKLPTHAGIVRTDGGSTASFEAFGPGIISLGTIGPLPFGDGNPNGGTAEDRFFGWSDPNGILAIQVLPSGVFEVDHLQYGFAVVVPEPGSCLLVGIGLAGLAMLNHRRRVLCLASVAVLWWATGSGPANADQPLFIGLGDLPDGSFDSRALGVSADGSVVVGTGNAASGSEAFRWTVSTGMVGLGGVSNASDVSGDGSVVVGQWGSQAFRWTQSTGMVGLGDLPRGLFLSSANAVSANGSVVVGRAGTDACGHNGCHNIFPPFRWTQSSGMVRLGGGSAVDVSADGSVIVGGAAQASRWTQETGAVGLGDLPGGSLNSHAFGISTDGLVIVGHGNSAAGTEAFRWTKDEGMVGLGILPGFDFSMAEDVSADGSVVVGSVGFGVNTFAGAFLWDAAHGMRSLRDVLITEFGLGASLVDWSLYCATAISADGKSVVGYGTNPNGNTEAWIARLAAEPTLPGDFNHDGTVDAADYIVWRKTDGTPAGYNTWRANFGQPSGSGSVATANATVPEPTTLVILIVATAGWCLRRRRAA